LKRRAGFTLIEMVMVIFLMSLFSTVLGYLMTQMVESSQLGFDLESLDWNVRESLERITRDMRQINPNTVTTMTSSNLIFTDQTGATQNYQYTAPSVFHNGTSLVSNIGSFAFSYFDGTGTSTTTAANVRYILVAVMFQTTDSAGTTSTPIYYTTIAVRNGV
jgi:prepilin-type N-terminal cleavage/methylation domain-containing protein